MVTAAAVNNRDWCLSPASRLGRGFRSSSEVVGGDGDEVRGQRCLSGRGQSRGPQILLNVTAAAFSLWRTEKMSERRFVFKLAFILHSEKNIKTKL